MQNYYYYLREFSYTIFPVCCKWHKKKSEEPTLLHLSDTNLINKNVVVKTKNRICTCTHLSYTWEAKKNKIKIEGNTTKILSLNNKIII